MNFSWFRKYVFEALSMEGEVIQVHCFVVKKGLLRVCGRNIHFFWRESQSSFLGLVVIESPSFLWMVGRVIALCFFCFFGLLAFSGLPLRRTFGED